MVLEIFLIILASVVMLVGLLGCIIPVIPGPPISWIGILILHFTERVQFSLEFLIIWLVIAVAITIIDNVIPIYGTKKAGGSKWGVWGAAIGLFFGLFFGPFGIIIGPFLGALAGELLYFNTQEHRHDDIPKTDAEKNKRALLAALGSFLGLMVGIVLKLVVSGILTFKFVKALITG